MLVAKKSPTAERQSSKEEVIERSSRSGENGGSPFYVISVSPFSHYFRSVIQFILSIDEISLDLLTGKERMNGSLILFLVSQHTASQRIRNLPGPTAVVISIRAAYPSTFMN